MGDLTRARQVADAVLYEGYLLYPYRASSAKNQVRWQFGILGPEGAEQAGVGEPPTMSAQVLFEAQQLGATIDICLRFLHVQARSVERREGDRWVPVSELVVEGTRWIPFHEAVPREVCFAGITLSDLVVGHTLDVGLSGGAEDTDVEELTEGGNVVGRLVRRRWALQGAVAVALDPGLDPRAGILTITVDNHTAWAREASLAPGGTPRDLAARHSFVGTHLLLTALGGRFLSSIDPPDWAAADAKTLMSQRCWPSLIADDDGSDAVLVAPIILGDHPTVAPESAGDLFDATEIDEILTLRVITMTDGEKAEARGTDPRAAAILDRCDGMTGSAMERLHGARRQPVDPAEPLTDSVDIRGVPVARGSRVLLRPTRRADAQDIFLAGQTALVTRVYFDFDGQTHIAVVLEDDPGRDLYDTSGRFYYFSPEEVEPLTHAGSRP